MSRAPADVGFAFVGWFLLAFAPTAAVVDYAAGGPGRTSFLAAAAVAVPLAALHSRRGWSVGPLGAMVFWAVLAGVVVGLPAALALAALGVPPGATTPAGAAGRLLLVVVVYAAASAAMRTRDRIRAPNQG